MSEPQDSQSPRKRGRPPVAEPCNTSLHVKLPEVQYDQLARFALKHDVPLAAFVRTLLMVRFDDSRL